jgi:hypothetical protein
MVLESCHKLFFSKVTVPQRAKRQSMVLVVGDEEQPHQVQHRRQGLFYRLLGSSLLSLVSLEPVLLV